VEGIITEFSPDHIISNPGLRIPIDCFAPNIRDKLEGISWLKVQLNQLVIIFLNQMIKEAFKDFGFRNMVGWNIVWTIIRLIASIATFLNMIQWMIGFFMMHLQKLDSHSGRMLIWHFQNMLMGLIAYTIMHQQYSMILLTKGQV
jgi:hypothetical protein